LKAEPAVATKTGMAGSRLPCPGEIGKVDEAFVKRIAAGLPNPICYVAGFPNMVGALRDALERAGVDGDDIRSEEFHGY
jgi:hypothetical protein